jgi:hypothetical protein
MEPCIGLPEREPGMIQHISISNASEPFGSEKRRVSFKTDYSGDQLSWITVNRDVGPLAGVKIPLEMAANIDRKIPPEKITFLLRKLRSSLGKYSHLADGSLVRPEPNA